jgi:hypothetical protein
MVGVAALAMKPRFKVTMILLSSQARACRPIVALFYAAILFVLPAVAQASEALTAQDRQDLTQALDKLTASRTAMAAMISECSGGMIMTIACSAPRKTTHPPGCVEMVASCDLVAAFRDTDAAIAALQKALKQ